MCAKDSMWKHCNIISKNGSRELDPEEDEGKFWVGATAPSTPIRPTITVLFIGLYKNIKIIGQAYYMPTYLWAITVVTVAIKLV